MPRTVTLGSNPVVAGVRVGAVVKRRRLLAVPKVPTTLSVPPALTVSEAKVSAAVPVPVRLTVFPPASAVSAPAVSVVEFVTNSKEPPCSVTPRPLMRLFRLAAELSRRKTAPPVTVISGLVPPKVIAPFAVARMTVPRWIWKPPLLLTVPAIAELIVSVPAPYLSRPQSAPVCEPPVRVSTMSPSALNCRRCVPVEVISPVRVSVLPARAPMVASQGCAIAPA